MVDFHSHILPNIDDGALNVVESVSMLHTLYKSGFTDVVLSSHYYSNKESMQSFISRRSESFRVLTTNMSCKETPALHLGAEVYLTSLLFNNPDLTSLTVNGKGKYMLTEIPYDTKLASMTVSNLERLSYAHGITPVIAHIERYPYLIDGKELITLLDIGCKAQVNFRAFAEPKYKSKLKKLIKNGLIDVLGTDCHGIYGLDQQLEKQIAVIKGNYGNEFLRGISDYSKEIFLC